MIMRHVTNDKNHADMKEKFLFVFKNIMFMLLAGVTISCKFFPETSNAYRFPPWSWNLDGVLEC